MLYYSVRSSISLSFSLCQFTRPFSFHSVFQTSVRFFASLHLSVLLYTLFSFIIVIYFVNIFFLLFILLSLHPTAHLSTCSSFCLFVHIVVRIFLLVYVLLVWLPVCHFVRFCPSVFLPVQLFILFFASLIAILTLNLLLPSRSSNLSWFCPFILLYVLPSVCFLWSQRFEYKRALCVFKHRVSAIGHRFEFQVNRSVPIWLTQIIR